jgi:hypothetical protein
MVSGTAASVCGGIGTMVSKLTLSGVNQCEGRKYDMPVVMLARQRGKEQSTWAGTVNCKIVTE